MTLGVQTLNAAPRLSTAQHFDNCASATGENATVAVQEATVFEQNGEVISLEAGDEIGMFSADESLCVGTVTWADGSTAITVWGDNSQTPTKDGMSSGEVANFRVWRQQENAEYVVEQIEFSVGSATYAANSLSVVSKIVLESSTQPTAMSVAVSPETQVIFVGQSAEFTIAVSNASELYGLEVDCNQDVAVTDFQTAQFGDLFDADRLVAEDTLTTQSWKGALSQRNPAEPLSGDGIFATLTVDGITLGTANINCIVFASDRNGQSLAVEVTHGTITVEDPIGDVNGSLRYQTRSIHSDIKIDALGPTNTSITSADDGTFIFNDLRTGAYTFKAAAAGHLSVCVDETVQLSNTLVLPVATMAAGDANGDGVVNMLDVVAVTTVYGETPNLAYATDFNNDGTVNIFDFTPMSGNFGESSNCE
ncbi:MAG: dockerin type I domain-containing protein [Candidatus Promineifilaceae bacterium]